MPTRRLPGPRAEPEPTPALRTSPMPAPGTVLARQRAAGNAAVARALAREVADAPPAGLSSPRFAGEPLLEACFANRARMREGTDDADAVSKVQQALADLGYAVGGVDGTFGPKTAAAVRSGLSVRAKAALAATVADAAIPLSGGA